MEVEPAIKSISIIGCLFACLSAQAVIAEEADLISWFDGDRPRQLLVGDRHRGQGALDISLYDLHGRTYRLGNTLLVHFHSSQSATAVGGWAGNHQLTPIRPLGLSNAWLFRCDLGIECITLSRSLYEQPEVRYAYPDFVRPRDTRFYPDDPWFTAQWYLHNTGQSGGLVFQDVDILSAWGVYTGLGISIAVVDDGLEIAHEDLSGNLIANRSWDYVDGDSDPTGGWHGTSVAGLAAAEGGNSLGITGAAPEAGLIGLRLLGASTDSNEADALTRELVDTHIYTNSWGPRDGGSVLEGPGPLTEAALQQGANLGRNGRGSIYVWAGGNGGTSDNANYDGYANSRFTISVAASTNLGTQASYSEEGANHLITAPSSGGTQGVISTAVGNSYVDDFGGTSAAAPLVAGIVALMLEANPDLGWRDVRQILAETADPIDWADKDWQTNQAGYAINHKYGFGRINASDAVNAALTWIPGAPEVSVGASLSPGIPIADNSLSGIDSIIDIKASIRIESVDINFTSDHLRWGDLEIMLISPGGTESVLARTHSTSAYDGNKYAAGWRFNSMRMLGEDSAGEWTLKVIDGLSGYTGDLQQWRLTLHGTVQASRGCEGDLLQNLPDFKWDASCAATIGINADNRIINSSFVQYSAPSVQLSPGFAVKEGSEFIVIN